MERPAERRLGRVMTRSVVVVLVGVVLAGCTTPAPDTNDDASANGTHGDGVPGAEWSGPEEALPPEPLYPPLRLDLQPGTFWTYQWTEYLQWAGYGRSGTTTESGQFRISLGSEVTVENRTGFVTNVETVWGTGPGPSGFSLVWEVLAADDYHVYGHDGSEWRVLFDAFNGTWSGSQFLQGDRTRSLHATSDHIRNAWVDLPAYGVATSSFGGSGGCSYYGGQGNSWRDEDGSRYWEGTGTVCTPGERYESAYVEFFNASLGFVSASKDGTYAVQSGSADYASESRTEYGLVHTNLGGGLGQASPWELVDTVLPPYIVLVHVHDGKMVVGAANDEGGMYAAWRDIGGRDWRTVLDTGGNNIFGITTVGDDWWFIGQEHCNGNVYFGHMGALGENVTWSNGPIEGCIAWGAASADGRIYFEAKDHSASTVYAFDPSTTSYDALPDVSACTHGIYPARGGVIGLGNGCGVHVGSNGAATPLPVGFQPDVARTAATPTGYIHLPVMDGDAPAWTHEELGAKIRYGHLPFLPERTERVVVADGWVWVFAKCCPEDPYQDAPPILLRARLSDLVG